MKPQDVALKAKEQLGALTGLIATTISDLQKQDDGWKVVLELLEMQRIPEASDVLGSYEVILSDQGDLLSYHRTRRYLRSDILDEQ